MFGADDDVEKDPEFMLNYESGAGGDGAGDVGGAGVGRGGNTSSSSSGPTLNKSKAKKRWGCCSDATRPCIARLNTHPDTGEKLPQV